MGWGVWLLAVRAVRAEIGIGFVFEGLLAVRRRQRRLFGERRRWRRPLGDPQEESLSLRMPRWEPVLGNTSIRVQRQVRIVLCELADTVVV
jgi:hypothetical protein